MPAESWFTADNLNGSPIEGLQQGQDMEMEVGTAAKLQQ
jgi:hypothetical protein